MRTTTPSSSFSLVVLATVVLAGAFLSTTTTVVGSPYATNNPPPDTCDTQGTVAGTKATVAPVPLPPRTAYVVENATTLCQSQKINALGFAHTIAGFKHAKASDPFVTAEQCKGTIFSRVACPEKCFPVSNLGVELNYTTPDNSTKDAVQVVVVFAKDDCSGPSTESKPVAFHPSVVPNNEVSTFVPLALFGHGKNVWEVRITAVENATVSGLRIVSPPRKICVKKSKQDAAAAAAAAAAAKAKSNAQQGYVTDGYQTQNPPAEDTIATKCRRAVASTTTQKYKRSPRFSGLP